MKSTFWLFGSRQQILQDGQVTDGRYDLIEGTFSPGAESPLHVHANYTETIIVLEGEVKIYVPGKSFSLKAGETHLIPKDTPHVVANNSNELPFKALCIAAPSGFAQLIGSIGITAGDETDAPEQGHDMMKAMQILAEIGDAILGPPGARP